jgi:hypothetical protein
MTKKSLDYILVTPPEMPTYLREGFTRLHYLSDHLEDESSRNWLTDEDFKQVAGFLLTIAKSDDLRAALFPSEDKKNGRYPLDDRNYLITFEYLVRRKISQGKKGTELADRQATADNWALWKVSADNVKTVSSKHKKECEEKIEKHLTEGRAVKQGFSSMEILEALLRGVAIAQKHVWKTK